MNQLFITYYKERSTSRTKQFAIFADARKAKEFCKEQIKYNNFYSVWVTSYYEDKQHGYFIAGGNILYLRRLKGEVQTTFEITTESEEGAKGE